MPAPQRGSPPSLPSELKNKPVSTDMYYAVKEWDRLFDPDCQEDETELPFIPKPRLRRGH